MSKKIKLENLVLTYCPSCYEYELKHPPGLVFHGISTKYLKEFPDLIIKPKQNPKEEFYDICKYYFKYLQKPKLHLSSLDRAGLANSRYDVHFAFRLKDLKKENKNIAYIDGASWDMLAFYELSERERKSKERNLFQKKYIYVPGKVWTEAILEELDLRISKFALVYSKKAYETVKAMLGANFRIYYGNDLRNILKKNMQIEIRKE